MNASKFHSVSSNTVNSLNQKFYLDCRLPSPGTCMIPEQFPDPVTTETTSNSLKSTANSFWSLAELGFHPQLDRHLRVTSAQIVVVAIVSSADITMETSSQIKPNNPGAFN